MKGQEGMDVSILGGSGRERPFGESDTEQNQVRRWVMEVENCAESISEAANTHRPWSRNTHSCSRNSKSAVGEGNE